MLPCVRLWRQRYRSASVSAPIRNIREVRKTTKYLKTKNTDKNGRSRHQIRAMDRWGSVQTLGGTKTALSIILQADGPVGRLAVSRTRERLERINAPRAGPYVDDGRLSWIRTPSTVRQDYNDSVYYSQMEKPILPGSRETGGERWRIEMLSWSLAYPVHPSSHDIESRSVSWCWLYVNSIGGQIQHFSQSSARIVQK